MDRSFWIDLVAIGTLIWLGYVGARLVSRVRLPAVTGFLMVGILVGPHGTGFLSEDLLHKIGFAEPLALGLIVFVIGEALTRRALARHRWHFWVISAMNILLPALVVGWAVRTLLPEQPQTAWLLATIAVAGAPATVMAIIAETKARGQACDMLLGGAALDNIATVVAYATVVPYLLWTMNVHTTVVAAVLATARQIGGALLLGVVAGFLVAKILERVTEPGELLALGLTNVVLVVAAAQALGVSSLLAPLVAGITVATVEEQRVLRERTIRAMRTVEYPVYIIFFTLAGAELELSAVAAGGLLMVAYIAGRSAAKFIAGFAGSLVGGYGYKDAAWLGFGMLPQAGVAVGLALSAGQVFPEAGPTVNAVVLASLVFFEVVGPMATKRAIETLGEAAPAPKEGEPGEAPRERTVLVPVGGTTTPERLPVLLQAGLGPGGRDDEEEAARPTRFVLAHVLTLGRPYANAAAMNRAQSMLETLGRAARDAGFDVQTRLARARTVEGGLADLAREVGAELVVVDFARPRPGPLGQLGRSPLRRGTHRVLDVMDAPVLVVPDDGGG